MSQGFTKNVPLDTDGTLAANSDYIAASQKATKTYVDTVAAPTAKGVTNGDSHDHNGGDGAQIAHTSLSSIGTNTHAQIDTHIAATSGATAHGIREVLTAARTYYVRTDGNDSNTGLANTAGGAFLTIQKAVNVACSIDAVTYDVTIQIGDGTYTENITLKKFLGAGTFTIQGNSGTPANVSVSPAAGNVFTLADAVTWTIKDMKLTGGTGAKGLYSQVRGANIKFGNLNFGAMASGIHIQAESGQVTCISNYTVSGNASVHMYNNFAGLLNISGFTITISGTPAFSIFAYTDTGASFLHANTFSGSATGQRYNVSMNGVIFTNGGGANYFPGNSAGASATGGQYV